MSEIIKLFTAAIEFMSPFWTGIAIGFLFGFLSFPRLSGSPVAKEWRDKQTAKKNRKKRLAQVQSLAARGLEFDAVQTISSLETGDRFCPECFEMDWTIHKLKPMHERYKPAIFCSRCGSRYI